MKKKYVLGFAFDKTKQHVVLITKQKPDWQKGKLNGVGGKIEEIDLFPGNAMVREFEEETGVETKREDWHLFANMVFNNDIMGGSAIVYCFRMFNDCVYDCETKEVEEIGHYSTSIVAHIYEYYQNHSIIKNLKILIPMAMDEDFEFATLNIN